MHRLVLLILATVLFFCLPVIAQEKLAPLSRPQWSSSRLVGSPEPPHPYRMEKAFPNLSFNNPLLMTSAPGTARLFVGEQEGRIYSFLPTQEPAKAELFVDLRKEIRSWGPGDDVKGVGSLYGLVFHPQYKTNNYCYICYVLDSKSGKPLPQGSRVSRFIVTQSDPPRVDPASEKVVLTFLAGGHNGGCLAFGPDGYLYISTGDATDPNPPDRLETGQDCSDLLSSILRIDVERESPGLGYRVPGDNPFVDRPGIRPEIWAFGFRNPWKLSFDRATGDLWVGDVGWELWEMVYRIRKGGNYGWSVMEGRQRVRPAGKMGPTPILPPTIEFPHTEAASITGGYVYRGKLHQDLVGAYICGDWVTRRVWATRLDGERITSHQELAQGVPKVVAFCEDNEGELFILHYDGNGGIFRLVKNTGIVDRSSQFPRQLSATGLFKSVAPLIPAEGVTGFSPIARQWMDGATAEYVIGLPGDSKATVYDEPKNVPGGFYSARVFFPENGVLAKTISMEMERGNPSSRKRLETQVLHYDGESWHGYSYAWNESNTDAELVSTAGRNRELTVVDGNAPGGKRRQTWHYPSRAECITCHNGWTGYTLAFTVAQLDAEGEIFGRRGNQIGLLQELQLVRPASVQGKSSPALRAGKDKLVPPMESAAALPTRARSYLHVNCSHCHQFGAGGTADLELRSEIPLEKTKLLGVRPVQGAFGIPDAKLVAPGDPYHSVLYYRMAKTGAGRMPHLGSEQVDSAGLALIHDWIASLPKHGSEPRIARSAAALTGVLETVESGKPSQALLAQLFGSTPEALWLASQLDQPEGERRPQRRIVALGAAWPDTQIRDLFERFLPDDQRRARLGSIIRPEQILSLQGDPARGRELVQKSHTLSCLSCHQIAGQGKPVGPELTRIGAKYSRDALLESLLDPSKVVDPAFAAYVLETKAGMILTGVLATRDDKAVLLRDAKGVEHRVERSRIESLLPQPKSLMPEQLLRDLTPQEAADLLAYLEGLK